MRIQLTRHERGWLIALASAIGILMFFWARGGYSNFNYFFGAVLIASGLVSYHITVFTRLRKAWKER